MRGGRCGGPELAAASITVDLPQNNQSTPIPVDYRCKREDQFQTPKSKSRVTISNHDLLSSDETKVINHGTKS
jgi:hypothetical protein